MEFNSWSIFIDVGLISALLLIGVIVRAKVPLVQKLFLPASVIAGILGLILGPNGFGLLPFSNAIAQYPGILIAVVFSTLAFTSPKINLKVFKDRVGAMWSYAKVISFLQWGGGLLFALLFINPFWKDLPEGFGLILASGFVGGHGTAAAVGEVFAKAGWEDARSLAMTSATVGIICSIGLGILLIKNGANRGDAKFVSKFSELSPELRTGLIKKDSRKALPGNTFSSIVIDPFIVHVALVLAIAFSGYLVAKLATHIFPAIVLPTFAIAFLIGLVFVKIMMMTQSISYVDKEKIERISGSATDFLVAFGIASINLTVVMDHIVPLALLLLFGIVYCYVFYRFVARRFFKTYWFEKAIFTWGWATGTVAMGIALLRIVDPDNDSGTLEDYGLSYMFSAPFEVMMVTFAPLLVLFGYSTSFIAGTFIASAIIYFGARKMDWLASSRNR